METIKIGVRDVAEKDLTESDRRYLRARWLLMELDENDVAVAQDKKLVLPDTMGFCDSMSVKVGAVGDGREGSETITRFDLDRLEDVYLYTRTRIAFTDDEKRQISKICRANGEVELADRIDDSLLVENA